MPLSPLSARMRFLAPALLLALSACGSERPRGRHPERPGRQHRPDHHDLHRHARLGAHTIAVTFTMQAKDAEGDDFSCVIDVNGDGYGDLNFGNCGRSARLHLQDERHHERDAARAGRAARRPRRASRSWWARPAPRRPRAPPRRRLPPRRRPPPRPPRLPPTPAPNATFQVTYKIDNDWGTGFAATVTIKNNGPAVQGWTLGWTYAGSQRITNLWNGTLTQNGQNVSVKDAGWNATIQRDGTVSFGFVADPGANAVPTAFTLNGVPVGTPDADPHSDPDPDPPTPTHALPHPDPPLPPAAPGSWATTSAT